MFEAVIIELAAKASLVELRPPPAHVARAPGWSRPVTSQCLMAEANRQQIELVKLVSVMSAEGGRVGLFSANRDGSYDIGPMQVNTIHLPELSRVFGISQGDVAALLAYDGCFNVAVGSWLLRKKTNEAAGDFWYGIGRYHSKTPAYSTRYILRVHGEMQRLVRRAQAAQVR